MELWNIKVWHDLCVPRLYHGAQLIQLQWLHYLRFKIRDGRHPMSEEERSPCRTCERLNKTKNKCAESCEELKMYQESFPALTLWRGFSGFYTMPGLHRTPSYRSLD
jgi:hypothetical protein